MMNVPAGTLPTANCPFMSVVAVCVLSPAMTVTVAPISGASLGRVEDDAGDGAARIAVVDADALRAATPTAAISAPRSISFVSSTSPLSFRQAKSCRPRSSADGRRSTPTTVPMTAAAATPPTTHQNPFQYESDPSLLSSPTTAAGATSAARALAAASRRRRAARRRTGRSASTRAVAGEIALDLHLEPIDDPRRPRVVQVPVTICDLLVVALAGTRRAHEHEHVDAELRARLLERRRHRRIFDGGARAIDRRQRIVRMAATASPARATPRRRPRRRRPGSSAPSRDARS